MASYHPYLKGLKDQYSVGTKSITSGFPKKQVPLEGVAAGRKNTRWNRSSLVCFPYQTFYYEVGSLVFVPFIRESDFPAGVTMLQLARPLQHHPKLKDYNIK